MRITGWKFKLFAASMALLLLVVLLVSASSQAASNNAFSISSPISGMGPAKIQQVAGNQAVINIDQFPQGGSPGDPLLPYKTLTLLVPPDTDLKKVKAKLAFGKWEELPGEYEIAPAPPAATSNEGKPVISWGGKDPSRIVKGRDTAIYGKNAYFPAETVQIESVGMFRQWKLVEVRVWLAVYNPVAKKVRVVGNPEITLTTEKLPAGQAVGLDSAVLPRFPKTEKFIPALKSKIANTQDIETFYGEQTVPGAPAAQSGGPAPNAPGTVPADYVIITTSKIVKNSTKLATFIAAKTAAGFTVKTVAEGPIQTDINYITGASNDARANNIRTWLANYYLGDGIQYVLLIGCPNSTGPFDVNFSVPMKMCWPRRSSTSDRQCPSDMFFAELSGNWDRDANGIYGDFKYDYGPGGADKNCELKVGRIPVYDANCADLDKILQKCIDYDTAPAGSNAWRSKVLVPAAISNFGLQDNNGDGDASDPGDYTIETFGDDWGEDLKSLATLDMVSPYTLYEKSGVYADGTAYPLTACNAPLNNANFINEWKNKYGFVTWWGHGDATSAARFTWNSDSIFQFITGNCSPHLETSFTNFVQSADCAQLDNNSPSFVVQVSCENGWPEVSNNLGYSLLKKGAIGTISGTRVTWYSLGSWDTGIAANTGDNASYGYYCFDRMASSGEDIGTALVYCRANFGTGWADGASWMNMIGFNLYGDPSLKLDLPGPKWKQEPDTSENGIDIRYDRTDGRNRILADDFLCTQTGPINKVTLWGSWFHDWYGLKGVINDIHLSIYSDKPAGINPFSEPNVLLWERTIYKADINETLYKDELYEHWWDPYTMMTTVWPGDTQIWKYDINIPYGGFIQQGDPCHPIIYWLGAYADLDMAQSPPGAMFGWKTAKNHWNDDAVRLDDVTLQWMDMHYPPGHPSCPNSIDLSFIICTGEEPCEVLDHLKWSQPPIEINPASSTITYCGWDEKSFNKDANMLGPWKIVADDFRCLGTMPITSIHWWGSYHGWEQPGLPPDNLPIAWRIAFWSNVPAFSPPPEPNLPYSYPFILLHSFQVPAARVTMTQVAQDQYFGYYPNDTCFKYSLTLEPNEIFRQNDFNNLTKDNIYWLSITAVYDQQQTQPPYYPWGWKSRAWHWMDDSVTFNLPIEPMSGQTLNPYTIIPIKDPVFQESFDMSFEFDTDPNYIKWEQPFTGIRDWPYYEDQISEAGESAGEPLINNLVADDWRCLRRTPITAVVWWGSYLGYNYPACSYQQQALPIKPDYFLLNMWTDVAVDPCDPNSFSHPGRKIWEYRAYSYDEVLVGYDKNPTSAPSEPVFRYSVRLPQENWFRQPDYNQVFWFSVVAVFGGVQDYDWGWTNHKHKFNDDAVSGDFNEITGHWSWTELFDQTQTSEDMSFMLFTDPNVCSTCANYNCDSIVNFLDFTDFADKWLAIVPPGGYDNSDLNCDGKIDWYDVKIFALQWLTTCP
ncbi:MAG: C25 family cysteine peptidase [Sedimentisphaerales bacterium]